MGTDRSELLNLDQAAELAGVSVPAFRLFVASGSVKPEQTEGKRQLFRADAVERVATLQREAVEQVRHEAIEKLAAEMVVVREAIANQSDVEDGVEALQKAFTALVDRVVGFEAETTRSKQMNSSLAEKMKVQEEQMAIQAKRIADLTAELQQAKAAIEGLTEVVGQAVQVRDVTAKALETEHKALYEQAKAIEAVRAEQKEARLRTDQVLDRLAEAFFNIRSNSEQPPEEPEPEKAPPAPKPAAKAVVETEERKPESKQVVEEPPAAVREAKLGVVREIEFNYLLERMGYRRLDSYSPEELVDSGDLPVPNDEKIKEFLGVHELGCDAVEVEISPVTRGGWQMIQYQRVARKNGKRPWIGAKR